MNKTEATAVNVILDWMTGQGSTEDAYRYAATLAPRVTAAVGAGGRQPLAAAIAAGPHLHFGPLHPAIVNLLAGCWENEQSDGGWPGGDIVEWLCEWFAAQGANITHPAVRSGDHADEARPFDDDPRGEWDEALLAQFAAEHGTDQYVPTAADGWPEVGAFDQDDEDAEYDPELEAETV